MCAAKYALASTKLMQASATYAKALQALSNDYTGRAFIIMSGKVAMMLKNLAQSYAKCLDAIKELTDVKGMFEETEKSITSAYSSLDTGNSPFNA